VRAERAPSGQTTLVEGAESRASTERLSTLALVVAWCREEPWRVGEVLLLPPASAGSVVWFGRGASASGEPLKTPLGQLRLGRWRPSPPLGGASISRYQLQLQALDANRVLVRNAGRCPLLVDDKPADSAELCPGDLAQLGQQLLLLCVRRPVEPRGEESPLAVFPFGEADRNGIVGESAAIWELRRQIAAVAAASGHVLVTGATGTGKELVAQAIHALSARASRPIVSRNAATLPESLVDAELFGNARNYPNPGMADRAGLIGDADGSTLFLDEIGELPQQAQAHLLRVLDAGEYQRLGESRPRRSDFRLVAATNREVSTLKHDLLARFNFQIAVPSLDSRREDLPLLVRHILRTSPGLDSSGEPAIPLELTLRLLRHPFVAGVRELRALLCKSILLPSDPPTMDEAPPAPPPTCLRSVPSPLTAQQVQACLDENNGAIDPTWRALGLSNRFALMRLIRRYDLEVRRRPGRRKRS
jgi:two-component system nitrogen regulation response regulator GlnG/two-component system response regulator HydG